MLLGYGISGIDLLGNYGLSAGGAYSSYDPYMQSSLTSLTGGTGAIDNSIFNAYGAMGGIGSMGSMGSMLGMYNPLYYAQLQNQAEELSLEHAGNMHEKMLDNQVRAYGETDLAIINKLLKNGSVQQDIQNLYDKVREGDQDGICEEFDKLRNQIFNTYKDEIAARGSKENPATAANQIVEALYGNIISSITGEASDLRSDIKRYGDGAMMNGFMKGFRKGHHDRYVDETLNHCFGLQVDQKGAKEFRQDAGRVLGTTASITEKGLMGLGAGAAVYGVGGGLTKLFATTFSNSTGPKLSFKGCGKFALAAAALAAIGDVIWQISDISGT